MASSWPSGIATLHLQIQFLYLSSPWRSDLTGKLVVLRVYPQRRDEYRSILVLRSALMGNSKFTGLQSCQSFSLCSSLVTR